MADTPLRADSVRANPIARRSLLGALAAVPIIPFAVDAATPGLNSERLNTMNMHCAINGHSTATLNSVASKWNKAVAYQRAAQDAHDAACHAHSTAQELYFRARPVMPNGQRFMADDTAETFNARWHDTKAKYEKDDAACRARFNVDETEEESSRACNEADAALTALIATPAPDINAIIMKIELGRYFGLEVGDLSPVIADLSRLDTTRGGC